MSNADLIERLRDDEIHVFDAHEAADALELADKRIAELEALLLAQPFRSEREKKAERRIAELEAAIVAWKADQKENMAIAVEECKRANEAERKLAVAREALVWINDQYSSGGAPHAFAAIKAREALARIGGE